MDMDTAQSPNSIGIGKNLLLKIKDLLRELIKKQQTQKIGVQNGTVVVDETAICRGKVIKCPHTPRITSMEYNGSLVELTK